jgi:hypothetical protein
VSGPTDPDEGRFTDVWTTAARIPGWLTEEQGRLLWREARRLPHGAVVLEIGSHQGRSTTILGAALEETGGRLIAVDPFVEGRLFGGNATRVAFEDNVRAAGLHDVVQLIPEYSTKLRPGWTRPIELLYVDGKHDYWTCSDDLRWSQHLPPDGAVLVHDAYSSIGVTLSILLRVLPSHHLRYVERKGSLALFRRQRPTTADRMRIIAETPWWLRNVVIKVLLRLRLRPVARLLGHSGEYDPY